MDFSALVRPDGWIDLTVATQTKVRGLPRRLRDEEGWTHVNTLVAVFSDAAVNPRSGGVIGHTAIASELARSLRQVERSVYNTELRDHLRWVDDVPASNVQSLQALRELLDSRARAAHLKALSRPTNVSSGSSIAK